MRLDPAKLKPGSILHVTYLHHGVKDRRWWRGGGPLIQYWLGDGCHDGIVIQTPLGLVVGDMVPPRGKLTPLSEYERKADAGDIMVDVLWPVGATDREGLLAGNWWRTHQVGKLYNFAAYILLPIKIISDQIEWPWDLKWDWCTEGVMWAWKLGAGRDVYENCKPTPYTTEKRWREGKLERVNDSVELI
jgi:hypothetical protein